jgi:hypothetical protein
MSELDPIVADAVARLQAVPDEALGELRIRRFGAPKIVKAGRAWRLGTVLLDREGRLYRVGRTTRAIVPPRGVANKSNEAEERREIQRAAVRGRFATGEPVNFGHEPLQPELVDGVWMIRWSPRLPDLVPLEAFLDERIRLLTEGA